MAFNFQCADFSDPAEAVLVAKEKYTLALKEYYFKSMLSVPIYTNKISPAERKRLELQLNSSIKGLIDVWRNNAKTNYCN